MKSKLFMEKTEVMESWIFRRRSSFKYLKDPLFLASVTIYFLNRFIVKPLTLGKVDFFHCYLNDLICIPFWLPIVLFLTRKVGLRRHDEPPDIYELCFYLLLWSFMFEFVGPSYGRYFNYPVADPWDILCYAIGCIIAGFYWNFEIGKFRSAKETK